MNLSHRVTWLLEAMRHPDRELWGHEPLTLWSSCICGGGWYRLGRLPNVGPTTLTQLLLTGLVEHRGGSSLLAAEFRLREENGVAVDLDLGDLWVAG